MAKKISENKISDITQDWGRDEANGLPYSGASVQDYIKREGIGKAREAYGLRVGATHFDPATMTAYGFHTEEDRDAWLAGDTDVWHIDTSFNFTGVVRQLKVESRMDSTSLYFTTKATEARIGVGFVSQQKGIADIAWQEIYEDFSVTVYVDKGSTGDWTEILSARRVKSGDGLEIDVRKHIQAGPNRVRIVAKGDTTGETGMLIYNVTLTTMYLTGANFAWHVPFAEGTAYALGGMNIGGAIPKTLKVRISNSDLDYTRLYEHQLGTATYVNNAYFYRGLEFPEAGTGVYNVEIWLDATGIESEHLHYRIMCVARGDRATAQLIAISETPDTLVNYETNELFKYAVYNGGGATASPTIAVSSDLGRIWEETLSDVATSTINSYSLPIEIETEDSEVQVRASATFGNIETAGYALDNSAAYPAYRGAVFHLSPGARSNAQGNRDVIINQATGEEISAEWSKIDFREGVDGYTAIDGRKCLSIPAYSKVDINYKPLASIGNGKTIDIAFCVDNISDYNEPVIAICDNPERPDFRGILIYPDRVIVHTRDLNRNDLVQGHSYWEGRLVSLQVCYTKNYKTNYGNLVTIAVNGVKKCEFAFSTRDNVSCMSNIILGSDTADLRIYSMRVYDQGMDTPEIMQNFVSSLFTRAEKQAAMRLIESAIDDSYNVDYETVRGRYSTMVVEMLDGAELPHYGLSKSYTARCNLKIDILDEDEGKKALSGEYLNQEISGQGTTSMNYRVWNLRWKTEKMRITAKKNYASGMQSHKMGATAAYNDLHEALGLTNEAGGRVAVYQYPAIGFKKTLVDGAKQEYSYEFIGMYTIGPDKGDKPTFGWNDAAYRDTLITLEGLDHNVKGAGYDYPYGKLHYSQEEESIMNDGGEKATEVGNSGTAKTEGAIQAMLDAEYRPAYECAYGNNPLIKGTTATLAEMNADAEAWGLQKDGDGHAYQRFEFWRDGEYDILYLNKARNRYEKNGTNLLRQLGLTEGDLSGLTLEEKNELFIEKRVEAFRNTASDYWDVEDNMFYVVFMIMFGAKDNGIKNTYPYKFGTLASGSRWRQRQDDLDSLLPYDNQGLASAKFWCEWKDFTDESKSAYVFKGEHSALVQLLLRAFPEVERNIAQRMMAAMQRLSAYGSTSIDKLTGFFRTYFFDKAQNYFPKSVYNKDVEMAYEDAWPMYESGAYDVDVHPLSQVTGDALETEESWIEKRMVYMMSKYGFGPFGANGYNDTSLGRINYRTQTAQSRTLTPAIPLYPAIANGVNTLNAAERVMEGDEVTISGAGGSNTNVYIMAADWLSDIGDLSNLQVDTNQEAVISVASKRLKRLKAGDATAANVRSNVAGLNIGICPSLISVDARNVRTLTGEVDLSRCPRLQEALFSGTDARSIVIREGSKITRLSLPESLTSISFVNLNHLEDLEYRTLENVAYFRMEGMKDGFGLLREAYAGGNLEYVRLVGIDAEGTSSDVAMLAELAESCRGIDAEGNPEEDTLPVVDGRLRVAGSLYESDYEAARGAYPGLMLEADTSNFYVVFADALVESICARAWGDGTGITKGEAESIDSVHIYPGGFQGSEIVSFNELESFVNVYLLGQSEFANCKELESIAFPPNIHIGTTAFSGCTKLKSIKKSKIASIGDEAFRYCSSLESLDFIDEESTLESIGTHAFNECTGLESADLSGLSALTEIKYQAFAGCANMTTLALPDSLQTIASSAFQGCRSLEVVDIPSSLTTIGSEAFLNCSNLETLTFPDNSALTSIGSKAFNGCKKIKSVVFPEGLATYAQLFDRENYTTGHLEFLDLPTTITSVYGLHMNYKSGVLICRAAAPPSLFDMNSTGRPTLVYVPDESVEAYKAAAGWSAVATKIHPLSEYTESEE